MKPSKRSSRLERREETFIRLYRYYHNYFFFPVDTLLWFECCRIMGLSPIRPAKKCSSVLPDRPWSSLYSRKNIIIQVGRIKIDLITRLLFGGSNLTSWVMSRGFLFKFCFLFRKKRTNVVAWKCLLTMHFLIKRKIICF